MTTSRGTSLASLLLLVGTAALLSGMLRSIVTAPHVIHTSRGSLLFVYVLGIPFPSDDDVIGFTLGSSVVIGIGCGIAMAVRRELRLRRLFLGVCGGCALGALAGAQLLSTGDFAMILIGSLALVAFGVVIHCTATPAIRTETEIEWFRRDDDFEPAPTGGREQRGGA